MDVCFVLGREENEEWKAAALRHGRKYGLEKEVADAYEEHLKGGSSEEQSAWAACYDWDVISVTYKPSSTPTEQDPPVCGYCDEEWKGDASHCSSCGKGWEDVGESE